MEAQLKGTKIISCYSSKLAWLFSFFFFFASLGHGGIFLAFLLGGKFCQTPIFPCWSHSSVFKSNCRSVIRVAGLGSQALRGYAKVCTTISTSQHTSIQSQPKALDLCFLTQYKYIGETKWLMRHLIWNITVWNTNNREKWVRISDIEGLSYHKFRLKYRERPVKQMKQKNQQDFHLPHFLSKPRVLLNACFSTPRDFML